MKNIFKDIKELKPILKSIVTLDDVVQKLNIGKDELLEYIKNKKNEK